MRIQILQGPEWNKGLKGKVVVTKNTIIQPPDPLESCFVEKSSGWGGVKLEEYRCT